VNSSVPAKEEEPTAYSVNARMSAWETMSSANQVSNIKRVDPGNSPTKYCVVLGQTVSDGSTL
jgi:hypothetical protein